MVTARRSHLERLAKEWLPSQLRHIRVGGDGGIGTGDAGHIFWISDFESPTQSEEVWCGNETASGESGNLRGSLERKAAHMICLGCRQCRSEAAAERVNAPIET
jgi:hypothetical protein